MKRSLALAKWQIWPFGGTGQKAAENIYRKPDLITVCPAYWDVSLKTRNVNLMLTVAGGPSESLLRFGGPTLGNTACVTVPKVS